MSVWIYGLSQGVRSSRKLEEALQYDLRFLFLASGSRPDYRTLCRFRRRHEHSIAALFVQTVRAAEERGLVLMEHVAVDRTKLEANVAGRNTFRKQRLEQALEQTERHIREVLAEVEARDEQEIPDERAHEPLGDPPRDPPDLRPLFQPGSKRLPCGLPVSIRASCDPDGSFRLIRDPDGGTGVLSRSARCRSARALHQRQDAAATLKVDR